jgi:hypothetical protein
MSLADARTAQFPDVDPLLGHLLPLPSRRKSPPPSGFTGANGAIPDPATRAPWAGRRGNVGLRLGPSVVGIDVDAYGDKQGAATWAALNTHHNLLPTWISTSRGGLRDSSVSDPARRMGEPAVLGWLGCGCDPLRAPVPGYRPVGPPRRTPIRVVRLCWSTDGPTPATR